MYISSIAIVFSLEELAPMVVTSISLDHVVGSTLLHAVDFVYKNPVVKSYLRNKYRIVSMTFKYSLYEV